MSETQKFILQQLGVTYRKEQSLERRKEYCKLCGKLSEAAKVSIRNIRRNANETLKRDKSMPEDQRRRVEQDVQKATDEYIKKVDQLAAAKEKEIMTI